MVIASGNWYNPLMDSVRDARGRFILGHPRTGSGVPKGTHNSPSTEFKKGMVPWNKGGGEYKDCGYCHNQMYVKPYRAKRQKYCSQRCMGMAVLVNGLSAEAKERRRLAVLGTKRPNANYKRDEQSPYWRGDKVTYSPLHKWVSKHLGRPTRCEHCGSDGLIGKRIHWANRSQEYRRELDDWIRLCAKCHKAYDKGKEKRLREMRVAV